MSHPFTPEYMQEGEMSSNQIIGDIHTDINNHNENETVPEANNSQIKSRQSKDICGSESVTDGGQVEEDPEGNMGMIREEMNITIGDKEILSFFKIMRIAIKHRMGIFANEVSILGLSYLVKKSSYKVGSILRKIVWIMLLLFGTGFMTFQIYDRISYYETYPTIVKYRVAYNQSLRFPTVTICTEVMGSKKALLTLGN